MDTALSEVYLQRYKRRTELRDGLLSILKSSVGQVCRVPRGLPDGSDGFGFRSGHISKLLGLVRVEGDPDIWDEELKFELFTEMLGGYPVYRKSAPDSDYFVSTYEAWSNILGKSMKIVGERSSA